jgi:hypothetical protein
MQLEQNLPATTVTSDCLGRDLTIDHILRDGTVYRDLGPEYCDRHSPPKLANRIRNLGYHVEISAPRCQFLGTLFS